MTGVTARVLAPAVLLVAPPAPAADAPAFPHGVSLLVAGGSGEPHGRVDSLPGDVVFPETDASEIYRGGPAFGAGLVFYNDRWLFEFGMEGRAFGLLTATGKELARPLGFLDADSRYLAFEIHAGRWFPVGRNAMIFGTVGNGIVFQRLGESGTYFHDNQYGLSLRAGAAWMPGGRSVIVRPYVRYQAISSNVPNDLTFLLGLGVALGRE